MAINIGAIAVSIVADNKSLVNGLKEANQKVSDFAGKFKKDFGAITAVAAGFSAGATLALKSFVSAAAEQEKATSALALALKNAGAASKEALKDQLDFASALQKTTSFADEQITSAQALIATFGATGDMLKQITKSALDLSTGLGIDLKAASLLLGKAFTGETSTLSRYGIIIDENIPKTQKFAAALEQVNKRFGGAAVAERETFLGQMKAMRNSLGEIAEKIGEAAIPALRFFTGIITKLSEAFQSLPPGVQQFIGGMTALLLALTAVAAPLLAFVAILPALKAGIALAATALSGFTALFSPLGIAVAASVAGLGFLIFKILEANRAMDAQSERLKTIKQRIAEALAVEKEFASITAKQAIATFGRIQAIDKLSLAIRGLATAQSETTAEGSKFVRSLEERKAIAKRIEDLKLLREEIRAVAEESLVAKTLVKEAQEEKLTAIKPSFEPISQQQIFQQQQVAPIETAIEKIKTPFDLIAERLGQVITAAEHPFIRSFQKGGVVPGLGSADKVPALLTPGETVLPRGVSPAANNFSITINNPVVDNRERIRELAKEVGEAILGKMKLQERFA